MKPTTDRLVDDYLEQLGLRARRPSPAAPEGDRRGDLGAHHRGTAGDASGGTDIPSLIAVSVLLIAPLVTTAYLARRMRKPTAPAL